jgi:LytS/YehU family sensor histidine kinase
MVVQLADLLRRLLSAGERDFSSLTDELQFVKHYLELQQRRFADRLSVDLPATHELPQAWVPSLIVQPLIENAVIHGLAGHQGPVAVRVEVRAEHGTLTLRISNTVALLAPPRKEGIGIRNVRERLSVQFEGRAVLRAGPEGPLWVSEISMPALLDSPERGTMNRAARGVDA